MTLHPVPFLEGAAVTTAPSEDVPRYFHDYALENERQHNELADQISMVQGELRMIKAISLGIFGTLLVAASKYVIGW